MYSKMCSKFGLSFVCRIIIALVKLSSFTQKNFWIVLKASKKRIFFEK